MNLTLLTQRADPGRAFVGWQPVYEFEDVILNAVGGRSVNVHRRPRSRLGLRRGYHEPEHLIDEKWTDGPRVLLVSVMVPYVLDVMRAIPSWRERFDCVAAYIVDSYYEKQVSRISGVLDAFDHIIVPVADTVDMLRSHTSCPVHAMPFGGDVFTHGSASHERPIDVASYGRQRADLLEAFQERFHPPGNRRVLIHSPIGRKSGTPAELRADRLMFWKLLRRTQIAINHDTFEAPSEKRDIPCSIITPRWFECLAAGCVLAGSLPSASDAHDLFDWEDAVIELPMDAHGAVDGVEALLENQDRLHAVRQRNLHHAAARHDWRHRVKQVLEILGLPVPPAVEQQLNELRQRFALPGQPSTSETARRVKV